MAQERSVETLLKKTVRALASKPHVALARIWRLQPGDICATCPAAERCPQDVDCLHLIASAGASRNTPTEVWDRLDGRFARFPVGDGKVGRIAATQTPVEIPDIQADPTWIADREWARREGILGFSGQPLFFLGEMLGVLAVFTRTPFAPSSLSWLRMIADQVAAAIYNTSAYEEIGRLKTQLELENEYLREEVLEASAFGELVGNSSALGRIIQQIELVAPTDANVLILGPSGTGKELVAREIHRRSKRADKPLVRVNCASIPRELYESEFFGHVKGAFTGAIKDRAGRFELANGGTLFLDEVGEIPLELQSKLLRVLQEGQYERVGDERTRSTDVRILAATNHDLKAEAEAGRFRQDLYYRLDVFPIDVPPLRARQEDVSLLANHFLKTIAAKLGKPAPGLTQANLIELQAYDWPGNVRELQNVVERALITAGSGALVFDLPNSKRGRAGRTSSREAGGESVAVIPEAEMRRRERDNVLAALREADWKVYGTTGAAALLGIKPTTLASRVKKMGLERAEA